jgi:hypothetical protein
MAAAPLLLRGRRGSGFRANRHSCASDEEEAEPRHHEPRRLHPTV